MISIPFHGSKKTSYKYIKPIIEKYKYKSVYEPFGGSGVLSVNLYKEGLVDRAVINDFDNFFEDYEEFLDYKDWLVEKCYDYGFINLKGCKDGNYYYLNGERVYVDTGLLPKDQQEYLQSLMKQIPKKFWGYFALGGNFTFAGVAQHKEIKLNDFRYFNSYLKTDKGREYMKWLKQIDVVSLDYKDFLNTYKSDFGYDSLLVIDPPYAFSSQNSYKGKFDLDDTKELIEILKELKVDFIFFNNSKEVIDNLLEGLNILYADKACTGLCADSRGIKRCDHFAFVNFS